MLWGLAGAADKILLAAAWRLRQRPCLQRFFFVRHCKGTPQKWEGLMLTKACARERARDSELQPWGNAAGCSATAGSSQGTPPLQSGSSAGAADEEPSPAVPAVSVPRAEEGRRRAPRPWGQGRAGPQGGSAPGARSLPGAVPRTRGWSGGSPRLVPPRARAGGGARDPRSPGSGGAGGRGRAGPGWAGAAAAAPRARPRRAGRAPAGARRPWTSLPAVLLSGQEAGQGNPGQTCRVFSQLWTQEMVLALSGSSGVLVALSRRRRAFAVIEV